MIRLQRSEGRRACIKQINSREIGQVVENLFCRVVQPNQWKGFNDHYKSYRREKQFTN